MGSQFKKTIGEYIGELSYETDSSQLFLPCEAKKGTMISIVLCDERGRAVFNRTLPLKAGKSLVSVTCSSIKQGQYNAWIEVNGETYLRQLSVYAKEAESDFLSRLRKWM